MLAIGGPGNSRVAGSHVLKGILWQCALALAASAIFHDWPRHWRRGRPNVAGRYSST
jgi:hypothetical protein